MHVLFVENAIGFGGSTVCAKRLVASCAGTGIRASIATGYSMTHDSSLGNNVGLLRLDRWRRHRMAKRLGRTNGFVESRVLANLFEWSTARKLARWIRRHEVDLVHANNQLLANRVAIVAAKMAGVPVVSHERGWPATTLSSRILERMVACRIAISDSVAEAVRKTAARPVPVHRVYDGIDDSFRNVSETYRHAARQSLGFHDEFVVGFPAVMTPWKGHRVFLSALAALRRRFSNIRGLILGQSPGDDRSYETSIRREATRLGLEDIVRFTGHIKSMVHIYAAMDAMVHASEQPEPFGLVIVEAMAAGVPVIAAHSGGPAEIITHGVNGFLHDPGKPELGRLISTLIERPHVSRQFSEAGRQRARYFDHARTWRGVINAYDELFTRDRTQSLGQALGQGRAPAMLAGGARCL